MSVFARKRIRRIHPAQPQAYRIRANRLTALFSQQLLFSVFISGGHGFRLPVWAWQDAAEIDLVRTAENHFGAVPGTGSGKIDTSLYIDPKGSFRFLLTQWITAWGWFRENQVSRAAVSVISRAL